VKYLTTLEVANELKISKQTLLNWLYAKKVPEPPRNRHGYRLWSPARVSHIQRLIGDGHLHRRTVIHREPSDDPEIVAEIAGEVSQFLRDANIPVRRFVRELNRMHGRRRTRPPAARAPGRRSSRPRR
jgi:DNA-binding transcriptional MerR regulator